STERLENLDEVLIKIEGSRASATLGDFPARRDTSTFGSFERRLSGAEAIARFGDARVRGIGASSRGNFRTLEFLGEEGKQGPYVLAGSGPNATGVIVAGSERVWLNGRLLTRGRDRDYVMDYSRGEIEFTNRVLVTAESRLAVDLEIAEQPYRRNLVLGEATIGREGAPFTWSTAVTSELDGLSPRNFTLNDERRAALEAAGDGPVLVSGAVCGVDGGDYVEEGDHFRWAGADSGTCDVSFVFLGENLGDYSRERDVDSGAIYFLFQGAGLGNYTPGLLLDAPRAHTLADTRLAWQAGRLSLSADGAFSREDRNRFSDSSLLREGAAGTATLAWESSRLTELAGPVTLQTRATFRGEQRDFASLGRDQEVWRGETWNFTDTTRADEGTGEATVALVGGTRWRASGTFGRLDRRERFASTRREGAFQWTGDRVTRASWREERVSRDDRADSSGTTEGDLVRRHGELAGRLGFLRPGATYYRDRREDTNAGLAAAGRDEEEWGGTLALAPAPSLQTDLRWARRTTDVVDAGTWVRDRVARTLEARTEWTPRRSVRARISWIHRAVDIEAGRPGVDTRSDLTRSDLSHEHFGGLFRGEYVYETTTRTFRNLVADPDAESVPTLALDASARLRIGGRSRARAGGGNESRAARWLSVVQFETLAQVSEETTRSDRGPIYRLDLSAFQSDDDTVFGRILTRQEVTLFPGAIREVSARWERIDTEDNRALPQRLDILTERTVLRVRNRLTPRWSVEAEGTLQDESRSNQSVPDFDVRLREIRGDLVHQPRPATRIVGGLGLVDERNDVNGARARSVEVRGELSTSVSTNGRARSEVTWSHPTLFEGIDAGNRFRTREDDRFEWRGTFELKVNEWVNTSVAYSGRAVVGVPTIHLLRAEVRALF
ncbi:MAG: hypothetical protein KC591_10120, partial [Gemmatimonadetes bacterium]|nr:hypothetical protein [Gemmatimonadota bacterium]